MGLRQDQESAIRRINPDYLEKLNSRAGVSCLALQDVFRQMTPEMGRSIFRKTGSMPESDDALIGQLFEKELINMQKQARR